MILASSWRKKIPRDGNIMLERFVIYDQVVIWQRGEIQSHICHRWASRQSQGHDGSFINKSSTTISSPTVGFGFNLRFWYLDFWYTASLPPGFLADRAWSFHSEPCSGILGVFWSMPQATKALLSTRWCRQQTAYGVAQASLSWPRDDAFPDGPSTILPAYGREFHRNVW